ncbi:MAG: histidine phosphatase family protein [Chloroflexota bacterium]
MPLLLLIRHGENDYVKTTKMAGRLPGVHLNGRGLDQAQALAGTLGRVPLKAIYASPLERAVETAAPLAEACHLEVQHIPDLVDTDVGRWQGRSWKALARLKAWKIVQGAPSRFTFPEGESFVQCQTRVVTALDRIAAAHRPKHILAVVFHADPIKLAVTHYLGLPLDNFQRLAVDTGSVTALYLSETGARLLWLNRRPPFDFPLPEKKRKKPES